MKIIVLGGGVIGTTTAYYLNAQGHQVVLIDRQDALASETSFANAGQISPGYSSPWAAPGIPAKAMKWLLHKHAPLAVRPDGSLYQLEWVLAMLGNCTAARYSINKQRMMRIAEYSRDCLRQLRSDLGIHYDENTLGTMQLFRKQSQYQAASKDITVLEQFKVPYQLLSANHLGDVEPALANHPGLVGGLRLPNDETGNCRLFTRQLGEICAERGVEFRLSTSIDNIRMENGRIVEVLANGEPLQADAYVLALGSYSRQMALKLGLKLPVYPVKGYSLSAALTHPERAPRSTIIDETYKIAVTRLGGILRIGGMAELAGFDLKLREPRRQTLVMVANDLFGGAANLEQANFWTGLRPMTPDGTPIIGATQISNLWLNTGHGTLGWTMACGSGALLADIISQRKPQITHDDLAFARYSGQH